MFEQNFGSGQVDMQTQGIVSHLMRCDQGEDADLSGIYTMTQEQAELKAAELRSKLKADAKLRAEQNRLERECDLGPFMACYCTICGLREFGTQKLLKGGNDD